MMKGVVLLGLYAVLVLAITADARNVRFMEAGGSDAISGNLRQLLQDASDSCGSVEEGFDYPSSTTLNNGREDLTSSNEECCSLCDRIPECKSWTRIKQDTRFNLAGECWLRDHVPKKRRCDHCDSAVKTVSVDAILDECEKKGQEAGSVASRGACSTLTLKCPAPSPLITKTAARSGKDYREELSDSVKAATQKTCKILFVNNCITSGFDKALEKDNACSRILSNGPNDDVPAPECESFAAAVKIFESSMKEICSGSFDD